MTGPSVGTGGTNQPASEDPVPTRTFVNVLILEAVIVILLWLLGRAY